jgi:hypothetical protein
VRDDCLELGHHMFADVAAAHIEATQGATILDDSKR